MPDQENDVLGKLKGLSEHLDKLKINFKHLIIYKPALTYMFLMNNRARAGQKNHRAAGGMLNFAYVQLMEKSVF